MSLRPSSRSFCATSSRRSISLRLVNFSSMGRLTPVTTSTLPGWLSAKLRVEAVPPNRSVRMRIPCPCWLRSIASSIRLRACDWSSSHPSAMASMRGVSPTIFCVADTSSWASGPWVTINSPIIPSFLVDVAMRDARGPAPGREQRCRGLGRGHRAVLASRASYRDGQIALPFLDVARQEESQEVVEPLEEILVVGDVVEESQYVRVEPGLAFEALHEERVLQEADVEHQIRLHRDAVLEAERDHR